MTRRIWHLFRARLAMTGRSGWPIPAIVFLGSLSTALAALVRDTLPNYPHAFLGLTAGSLFLTIPLLTDLGALLRTDEAGEWAGSLPARASERTLARMLHALTLLGALVLAWYVPWAAFAPEPLGWADRLILPILGFGLALLLATLWAWAQQGLLGRAEGALITLETGVMAGVVFGLVHLLSNLPRLSGLRSDHPDLAWFPATWFARSLVAGGWALGVPAAVLVGCLAALTFLPEGRARVPRRRVGGWLAPLHRLALRHWVRPEERGPFELVWSALPREREVALRTYPMLGIPLAFLLGLLFLRLLYRRCVKGLPLSTAPEDLRSDVDWAGWAATLAVGLTVLAVLANRFLGWIDGLVLAMVLGLIETLLERNQAARTVESGRGDCSLRGRAD